MADLTFRKTAQEHYNAVEDHIETIQIITPKHWLILYAIGFFLVVVVLWSFFGSIATRVNGYGILFSGNGLIYDAVAASDHGTIVAIRVKPGDRVRANDVVAYIDSPDLSHQIHIQEEYLKKLDDNLATLTAKANTDIEEKTTEFENTTKNLKQNIDAQGSSLQIINDLISRKLQLLAKAYVSRDDVASSYIALADIKQRIQDDNNQMIQAQANLDNIKQQWSEKIRELHLKIIEANRDLSKLNDSLNITKTVYSPISGIVTNIQASIGDKVKEGSPIVSIADEHEGLDALIYVPASDGQRIKLQANALVSPLIIEKEEFGSMVGQVLSISQFPSSPESMMAALHNQELVKRFSQDRAGQTNSGQENAEVAVRIKLEPDPNTFSGFKWTSALGPEQKINPGVIVRAQITVRQQSPISLIIPAMKRLFERDEQNGQ